MKKVLKNILKWLVLVFISFSVIFTAILSVEYYNIIESIAYKVESIDESILYNIESSELEQLCKYYQEIADRSVGSESNIDEEYLSDEEKEKQHELKDLYKKYPVGFAMTIRDVTLIDGLSSINIISLIMGIVVGTAIYLMLDKEKKGLKIIIVIYILFILILGFVEGIESVAGDNLTLLDRWMFPETYIIPVTVAFALVVATRVIKQKEIAKKLNEKLKERKEEKNK